MNRSVNHLKILFVLFVIGLFSACKKDTPVPTTCASVSADSTSVGKFLLFSNCSKGATSSLWNFGDNSTSNMDTIWHAYYLPGVYTATLTTQNQSGTGITKTFKIIVSAPDYWTFKGIKNYASYVNVNNFNNTSPSNYLISYHAVSDSFLNISQHIGSSLVVSFAGNTPPLMSHIDSVKSGYRNVITSGAAISIEAGDGGLYTSAYSNQIINISVDPNGKTTVTGDNIKMYLMPSMADSSTISFHLTDLYQ